MFTVKKQFKILYDLVVGEKPQKAEVIVWLQGDRYDRAPKVFKLYKEGWAKKIIISGNNVLIGGKKRVGENNISLDEMKNYLLKKGIERKSILIDDGAMNTKDQAKHILKIALNKKWSKLILVGSSYYQPRAFLTFLKQAEKLKWVGKIVNQPAIIAGDKKPSGRDKSARIFLGEELKKIEKYQPDLALISQGIEYLNKKIFSLRKAQKNDARLLFGWANDPETRANSKNIKLISWPEHSAWLTRKLADASTHIYILTEKQKNIGIIRFEQAGNKFMISYSIDCNYRGQGFGALILKMGMDSISKIIKKPSFIGYVQRENIPSNKIFNKSGFVLKKKEVVNKIKFNVYQKRYE